MRQLNGSYIDKIKSYDILVDISDQVSLDTIYLEIRGVEEEKAAARLLEETESIYRRKYEKESQELQKVLEPLLKEKLPESQIIQDKIARLEEEMINTYNNFIHTIDLSEATLQKYSR